MNIRIKKQLLKIYTVINYLGSVLYVIGFFFIIPLVSSVVWGRGYGSDPFIGFTVAIVVSFVVGFIFKRFETKADLKTSGAVLVCSLGWIVTSAVGAIPLVFGIGASYLDAYFEIMSGFTTTGITMFTGLDNFPISIILWRSITQWVGGLGILTFFLFVTSQVSGISRLFSAESHKIHVKRPVPGIANTIKILWGIYILLTSVIFFSLVLAGSSLFSSLNHALTTLSTGGFSPFDASIAHYQNIGHSHFRLIEYIIIFGMFLGGTNFLIHFRMLRGEFKGLIKTTEFRRWVMFIALFTVIIFLERVFNLSDIVQTSAGEGLWAKLESNFRASLFQVVSVITTTGFATKDIASSFFGSVSRQLFIVMMIMGGCVGSTAGGIKILRVSILLKMIKREIKKLVQPNSALDGLVVDHNKIDSDEIYRVSSLFFIWVVLLIFGGIVTAFFSNVGDFAAFSGMSSALGNIGPSYISIETMSQFNPIIKIVYILGMMAGRLEIIPVLLLFSPRGWEY